MTHVLLEKKEHIAVATINRPKALNALNSEVLSDLNELVDIVAADQDIYALVITGSGEKAFVATALYFAILKVRPTPFCLLDEIDAALDDRNVERFASYLHNRCMRTLAGRTQFIVITHRRGTMEASDVLYGVTMQEQGVSKLLRLDLNQMEEYLGIVE